MSVKVRVVAHYDRVLAFLKGEPEREARVLALWKDQGSQETMGFIRGIVPVKTGFLRESVTRKLTPKGFQVYASAPYARFVDQGTRPHYIFAKHASVLRWHGSFGNPVFAKHVFHPGTTGKLFVQRTRDAMHKALQQMYASIWREQN